MTKEELMALAQEAGVVPVNRAHLHLEPVWWSVTAEDLERFAALITGHEREECAKLCDRHAAEPLILRAMTLNERPFSGAALDCAELIRMRSNAGGNATERSEGRVDHNVGRLTPGKEQK